METFILEVIEAIKCQIVVALVILWKIFYAIVVYILLSLCLGGLASLVTWDITYLKSVLFIWISPKEYPFHIQLIVVRVIFWIGSICVALEDETLV